jgi:hypothetical protein
MTSRILSLLATAAMVMSMDHVALATESAPTPAASTADTAAAIPVDAPAHAVVAYAPPAPTPARQAEWYGWQTLLVDGVAIGTIPLELAPSASFTRTPSASYLLLASVSTYAIGAPLVHIAHGHTGRGLADLGLRVGAVAAGGIAGAALGKPGTPSACEANLAGCLAESSNGLAVGATIGAVLASLIDASLLARETKPAEMAPSPSFTWSPLAAMTKGGGTAGLQGSF